MSTLTSDQVDALRSQLDTREAALRDEVAIVDEERTDTPSRAPQNQVEDLGEQGEQRIRDAVRHAEQARDIGELRDIAAARERVEAGTYGECVDCGVDIALARLQAQPQAARCIECQETFEASHPSGIQIPPML